LPDLDGDHGAVKLRERKAREVLLYVRRKSRMMLMATASPSLMPSKPSERQCTPAASRPRAMFEASLFNSPPMVSAGPLNGNSTNPSSLATTGSGITNDYLKKAITSYGQESDRERSREAGLDEHVVKPVEWRKPEELLTSLMKQPHISD
jgi:hypothetical protein